jgi:hypothetical protein
MNDARFQLQGYQVWRFQQVFIKERKVVKGGWQLVPQINQSNFCQYLLMFFFADDDV